MPEPPPQEKGASGRNLPVAIATGLFLAGLIFLTLFSSRPAFFVLVAVAVLTAQQELYRVMRARGVRAAELLGGAAGGLVLFAAHHRGTGALTFVLAMAVPAAVLWFLADPNRDGALEGIAATLFGIVYVPFFAAHVLLMRGLPDGAAITISYFGLVAFYDVSAYATGTFFGRHPMAPRVSPKKSWEGAAGGTAFIVLLALLAGPHIGPFTLGTALALAAVTAVVAPLGDLAESMIKRDLGVKDMGSVLPGHGGVLDRIDSMILVAPAAYWLVKWLVF
jgi:phosphatidate cytidylyltransferase